MDAAVGRFRSSEDPLKLKVNRELPLPRNTRLAGCRKQGKVRRPQAGDPPLSTFQIFCSHGALLEKSATLRARSLRSSASQAHLLGLLPPISPINFKAAGCADLGTPYTSAPFPHTPTCMRPVHFEASLWIALVRNMSMHPGNNGPLRTRPTQLGTEQQGRLSLHPASLPRTLRRFAFALWPPH
jgi:hypothetical protein